MPASATPQPPRPERPDTARARIAVATALCALVAVGAWLRLGGLAAWQLSWDDMWHLMDAAQPDLAAVLGRNLHHQIHGPLAYVLRHGLLELTHDPLWLRAQSWMPGLLLVPASYALGRRAFGRAAGLFLAGAVTFAHALVVQSQSLRAYVLLVLLLTVAVTAWLAFARASGPARGARGVFAGAALAAAFTHVSALIPLAALAAVETGRRLRGPPPRALAGWLALQAAILAPAAAWSALQLHHGGGGEAGLARNLGQFVDHFYFLRPRFPDGPLDALGRAGAMLGTFLLGPDAPTAAGVALGAVAGVGAALAVARGRGLVIALCGATLAGGAGLGIAGIYPFHPSRHGLYALPFLLLPLSAAVQALRDRVGAGATALAGAVAVVTLFPLSPGPYRQGSADFYTRRADWLRVLDHLGARVGPRDVVIVNRVGLQYLNVDAFLRGMPLEHVDHEDRHFKYPYDVWIRPGEESHRLGAMRIFACGPAHEWSSYLAAPDALRACVDAAERAGEEPLEHVWFLVEKPELFLGFALREEARRAPPESTPLGRELAALRRDPFWRAFFSDTEERIHAGTAGAFALTRRDLRAPPLR